MSIINRSELQKKHNQASLLQSAFRVTKKLEVCIINSGCGGMCVPLCQLVSCVLVVILCLHPKQTKRRRANECVKEIEDRAKERYLSLLL